MQELEHTGTALEAMETSHKTLNSTTTQYGTQVTLISPAGLFSLTPVAHFQAAMNASSCLELTCLCPAYIRQTIK